jgi:hypothetical protein
MGIFKWWMHDDIHLVDEWEYLEYHADIVCENVCQAISKKYLSNGCKGISTRWMYGEYLPC